jgi:hypothetical protein
MIELRWCRRVTVALNELETVVTPEAAAEIDLFLHPATEK